MTVGPDPGPDDRALLTAHVAGDADAFGMLFARHRDRLWAVALRTTGDPEEAADALQDAMISAFRRAETFRGDAAGHHLAAPDRGQRLPRPDPPLPGAGRAAAARRPRGVRRPRRRARAPSAATEPEAVAERHDLRGEVLAALDTLPPDQRAALVLVDMQGYPVEEAARILECPTGTVKSRCSRGRARLAALLPHLAPEPPAADGPGSTSPRPRDHAVPASGTDPPTGPSNPPSPHPTQHPRGGDRP